jgi:hypothetical protein
MDLAVKLLIMVEDRAFGGGESGFLDVVLGMTRMLM